MSGDRATSVTRPSMTSAWRGEKLVAPPTVAASSLRQVNHFDGKLRNFCELAGKPRPDATAVQKFERDKFVVLHRKKTTLGDSAS